MTPLLWMSAPTLASWALVAAATDVGHEAFWGLLGPLAAACVSWVAADRTYARAPERVTAVMIAAFGAKMVFFGAYVAVALLGLGLAPVPFVVSFTGYFITLHLMEALFLRRLFAGAGGQSR